MLYNLRRINEVCKEHVENNFRTLPERYITESETISAKVGELFEGTCGMMASESLESVDSLRMRCDRIKDMISESYHRLYSNLHEGDPEAMSVLYVYMNVLQETQEMVSSMRKYLRAFAKLKDSAYSGRSKAKNIISD